MSQRPRRRIVACVDGTWYDADGQEGQGHGNNSNVFRIFAAIGGGVVNNDDVEPVEQITEYFAGIGTNERPLEKFNCGVTGEGCAEQIARVYKYCCQNIQSPEDELWFYGFSRGAYVVTAVAGLLDKIGALVYDDHFDKTYETALNLHKAIQKGFVRENSGKLYYLHTQKSRKCPRINFLGLLDTVKRVNSDLDSTAQSLTFHDSIRHVRHALALNDTRSHFKPEMYGNVTDKDSINGRSLIQAWFVGAHADIGGGARDDGLSLYPLQWLLTESQHKGLILQHNPNTSLIEDPQALVFPTRKLGVVLDEKSTTDMIWEYVYANGIKVEMQDLRQSHNHGNMQTLAKKLTKKKPRFDRSKTTANASPTIKEPTATINGLSTDRRHSESDAHRKKGGFMRGLFGKKKSMNSSSSPTSPMSPTSPSTPQDLDNIVESNANEPIRHIIRLNPGFPHVTFQSYRTPFRNGRLLGYSDGKHGAFGTIIHPSVYFVMDVYARHGIELAMKPFQKDIDRFRDEQHSDMRDPWLTMLEAAPQGDVKACRILVCGRTGVGKSTLINKVFGVPMTIESHMKQGDHDINEAFESDKHPGIIIHDSRGFQAGDTKELDQFEKFIKKRSAVDNPKESLHAIWICIQTDTDRVIQTSEVEIFTILAAFAAHIPIIIVGTKKDKFLDQQESVARRQLAPTVPNSADLDKQSRQMAAEGLQARQSAFRDELEKIPNLNINSIQFVHVSKDDENSIRSLVNQTLDLINNDEARLRCTAAQVIDVEPKIKQAIEESIRLLRHGVWASSVGAVGIVVPSITTPTISRILCDNILICFGFPKINPASVNNIMNKIIGWNLIRFLAQQVSQSVTLGSLVAGLTIVSLGGGAPIIGLMSLLEAPAAARMIIKCACDLILILDRAFKHGGKFVTSTDIELASREYVAKPTEKGRSKRKEVHARVMKLIPIVSKRFWNSVRISKIKVGMDEIIRSNRWEP
ncbi:hypothetical protein D6D20_09997, partial [Aureobasidium pullulans]